jgi:hypothetical protein
LNLPPENGRGGRKTFRVRYRPNEVAFDDLPIQSTVDLQLFGTAAYPSAKGSL